ncbi:MAG: hypothetical protein HGA86_02290, partial [Anaerolineaceae bacterium]|nr:hypothetical protein [Anaerolineaceae bacterium]
MREQTAPCCSNQMSQIIFRGFVEIIGQAGTNATFHLAGLTQSLDSDLLETHLKEPLTPEQFSTLRYAVDQLYGLRGGRGASLRAGRAAFRYLLRDFGEKLGLSGMDFRLLPTRKRMNIGQQHLSSLLADEFRNTIFLHEDDTTWFWEVNSCQECLGQKRTETECTFMVGLLQESLQLIAKGMTFGLNEVFDLFVDLVGASIGLLVA